jgi:large subunit ribosomal protein L24
MKKGDKVIIIAGNSKNKKGEILKVFKATNRVIVSGAQKVKKHIKPKSKSEKGSIVEIESSIHMSNVMLIDPKTGKGTRVQKKHLAGKTVRIAQKSGQEIK